MPSLRERIANALVGDRIKKLDAATSLFIDAYERQVVPTSPEVFVKQLQEMDPHYIDFLVRQLDQRAISGSNLTEQMRLKTVEESRSLYVWDVITQNIVDLWTDFGFGLSTEITCEDEKAQETFREYWTAKRNSPIISDRVLKDLSKDLLVDGELYFVFFSSRVDGMTTVRLIPTEQIVRFVTDPDDKRKVLYYERQVTNDNGTSHTVYYRDWQANDADLKRAVLPDGAIVANSNDLTTGTDVVVLHAAYRIIDGRGWPLMTAGAPWSRAYRNFLQDRAAVARQAAMYNEKIKVKGSQRVIDDIKTRLESSLVNKTSGGYDTNPAAVAGSTWLENESAERSRMPMGTGASDAEKDGGPLLAQAGLAGRVFPHYLGRGEAFRLATASAMETPIMRAFNRYQTFWSSIFRDMVEIILTMKELYGRETYSTYAAKVSTDSVISVDIGALAQIGNSLVSMTNAQIIPIATAESISTEIMRVALQTVGVADVDKIINPEVTPAEMAESAEQYQYQLKYPVRGLWSSTLTIEDFASAMQTAIDRHLTQAWKEGMAEAGVEWADRTQEEMSALDSAILSEYSHVYDFGKYIMDNDREHKGKLRDLENRTSLWANRWRDIKNRALLMAGANLPLTWHYGGTEQHCEDCQWANGRTYRASIWEKYGWRPQSMDLECKGYHCECGLSADGERPLRGHPRKLA